MMLEKGANYYYDLSMIHAAEEGHKEMVELMLEKEVTSYDDTMEVEVQG